jgi:KDO2-lipid IV(A) lauroyltransferase
VGIRSARRLGAGNAGLRRACQIAAEAFELFGYRAGCGIARSLPLGVQQRALEALARALVALGERRARWAMINLALAFPDLDARARRALAERSYAQLAWNLLDTLRMGSWSETEIRARIALDGLENLRGALAGGRGALLVVPHMGCFELGLQRLALAGIACAVVVRSPQNRWLAPELARLRARHGIEVIERRGALRRMREALRKGKAVVVALDQASRRERGVFVPLFGLRVAASSGVALLALRSRAPIVPSAVIRTAPDRHRGLILTPIEASASGDRARDVELVTAGCMAAIESLIRRYPEHWMWTYRRFRNSPDLGRDPYARLSAHHTNEAPSEAKPSLGQPSGRTSRS